MEVPKIGSFTCVTCHVIFKDAEMQRCHYKTDWHRYNLKRKVADLPPVSAEEFQNKVHNQRNLAALSQQDKSVYCQVCRKSFGNEKTFDNHLNSKKHKDSALQNSIGIPDTETPIKTREKVSECETEVVDSDEWDDEIDNPIDNNDCIFCLNHSHNFMKNLEHMTVAHSFFIPDIEFCVDIEGLIRYLGEKIASGFMCLWCNEKGRTFHSADAARSHMVDKGHCRMLHEGLTLAEYADYFDYSSSYPSESKTNQDDDDDDDKEVSIPEIDDSEYQLVLPSGAIVGHRSLMRYYRQNFNPNSTVVLAKNNKKLHKVLAQYRALGWTATQQESAARKARDLHYMKRMHAKLNVKLGVKANKFQPHFRQQVNY